MFTERKVSEALLLLCYLGATVAHVLFTAETIGLSVAHDLLDRSLHEDWGAL